MCVFGFGFFRLKKTSEMDPVSPRKGSCTDDTDHKCDIDNNTAVRHI